MRRTDRMQGPKFRLVVADATVLLNPLSLAIWRQCVCVSTMLVSDTRHSLAFPAHTYKVHNGEREKERELLSRFLTC